MASQSVGRAIKTREWVKRRPFLSTALASVLGVVIGAGGASANQVDLEARLSTAMKKARAVELAAATEIGDLESANSAMEGKNESLQDENAKLKRQISRLNAKRDLPRLVGASEDYAANLEDKYGWTLRVTRRYSNEKAGTVLSQSPAPGTMMSYAASFKVVVAKTIPAVPDLIGMTRGAAIRAARADGYQVVATDQISTRKPGTVLAMSPGAGSRLVPGQTLTLTVAIKAPPAPEPVLESTESNCTPGYDPCLPPASDYDCSGGTGDGPEYTGYVRVTGSDPYDLDADNDGVGCE